MHEYETENVTINHPQELNDDLAWIDSEKSLDYLDRHLEILGALAVHLECQASLMDAMSSSAYSLGLGPVNTKAGACAEVLYRAAKCLRTEQIRLLNGKIAAGKDELQGVLEMIFSGGRDSASVAEGAEN